MPLFCFSSCVDFNIELWSWKNTIGSAAAFLIPLSIYQILTLSLNCNKNAPETVNPDKYMGMNYTRLCFFLLLSLAGSVYAQKPLAPPMYFVTVDPETGNDCITWYSSPSAGVDFYRVAIRVVTMPGEPDSYIPIGMIPVPDTTWCNTSLESGNHSVGYAVWAMDGIQQSLFNQTDSTMFLQAVSDSCNGSITLNWNDYNSWRGKTSNYNVYRRLGIGVYLLIASADTNYFVINSVPNNQTYELFVEAVHTDGIRRSTSNLVTVNTHTSQLPDYINADYATISADNTIDLSFTIGGTPATTRYKILRSGNPSGPFNVIDTLNTPNQHITYTDDTPFRSGVYFYKLEVISNCGTTSGQSNMANNILLSGSLSGTSISISWNEYADWEGGVDNYRIIRSSGHNNPVVDTLNAGTLTSYTDDISSLVDYSNPVSSFICYRTEAVERVNVYGIRGRSLSNQVCFSVTPDIRMPNAIIPNDNEPVNRVLEPVFSFAPESYELFIYNRLGTRIWEGKGPWDGKASGRYVPEGVYLYLLRVFNYSTDIRELSGKVTVVYR
jgi:hypothetical protein